MHYAFSIWHLVVLAALAVNLFGGMKLGWFGPFDGGPRA
jgi:Sec-independent protein translocase protein TatA